MQEGLRGAQLIQLRVGKLQGKDLLQFWLGHLALCAGGTVAENSLLLAEDKLARAPVLTRNEATRRLETLLGLYRTGLCRPATVIPERILGLCPATPHGSGAREGA